MNGILLFEKLLCPFLIWKWSPKSSRRWFYSEEFFINLLSHISFQTSQCGIIDFLIQGQLKVFLASQKFLMLQGSKILPRIALFKECCWFVDAASIWPFLDSSVSTNISKRTSNVNVGSVFLNLQDHSCASDI